MTIQKLDIAEPFFSVSMVSHEASLTITGRTIVLNLADSPIRIREQTLGSLQSVILRDTQIETVQHAILVERFDDHPDEAALMEKVRQTWPSAFEVRGEERLRGIGHYMSPKIWIGQHRGDDVPLGDGAAECRASPRPRLLPSSRVPRGAHADCRVWQDAAVP